MRIGLLFVAIILRLLPTEDRRAYAAEMEVMTARRWSEVRSSGVTARSGFWLKESGGALRAVCSAWADRLPQARLRLPTAGMWIDARASVRAFARQPLFLVSMVATLATGIGVNAAFTALGWAALWAPLPYPEADRLVRLYHDVESDFGLSLNEVDRYRQSSETLSALAGWSMGGRTLDDPDAPARVTVARVTPDLFDLLGRPPASGRGFGPDGSDSEAVLSHRFWTSRYGQSPGAIGSSLSLDGVPVRVVGVLPPTATFPDERVDIYTAVDVTAARGAGRGPVFLDVVARLQAGTSLVASQSEIATIAESMRRDDPEAYEAEPGFGGRLVSLRHAEAEGGQGLLLALLAGAFLVLIATCLNVATLLSGRVRRRLQQTHLRRCLGASQLHILRGQGLENALIAGLGGIGAVALASLVIRTVGPYVSETSSVGSAVTGPVVLGLVVSVTIGVALVLTAGAWVTTDRTTDGIRPGRSSTGGKNRFLLLASLAQLVSAVVLVSGSILLGRTVHNLVTTDLGYTTENTITARVSLPTSRYGTNSEASAFFVELLSRLEQRPEVGSVGLVNALPLSELGGSGDVYVESVSPDSALLVAESRIADPGYFSAMGIPLLAGRGFETTDRPETPRIALVDETFARRFFASPEAAVGERMRSFLTGGEWAEIVGVVGHTRHSSPGVVGGPQIYVSALQRGTRGAHIVVGHRSDPSVVSMAVQQELAALDPRLPLFDVGTMESRLSRSVERERLLMAVFVGFASLAILLSALGTYSVVRLGVDERLREIGIRRAIGAPDLSIVRVVAGEGLLATAIGVPLGLIGSFAMGRVLQGLVFEVPATDPASLGIAAAIVALTGCVACIVPVRSASRSAPATLIRDNG